MSVNQQLSQPAQGLVNLDQYYSQVCLLLHMDGSNGSTTFTDSSLYPKTATGVGNAQISTAQSKFGGSSLFLDGTGDYLTIGSDTSLVFGTGDLTVECWVYQTTATSYNLFTFASQQWCVYYAAGASSLRFYDGTTDRITGGSVTLNTWTYIALTRRSGVVRLYINGTQTGLTYTESVIANLGAGTTYIGYYPADVTVTGYIDDLRITKGVARYTSNFNPPGAPFPDNSYSKVYSDPYYSSVSLLLHMDGPNGGTVFRDNSPSPKSITIASGATLSTPVTSTTQKKYGVSSAFFDGAGDYLVGPASGIIDFGSGDFTVEGWVYVVSYPDTQTTILSNYGTSGQRGFDVRVQNNGTIASRFSTNGSSDAFSTSSAAGSLNTWQHFAVVRQSSLYTAYLNGVGGTATNIGASTIFAPSSQLLWIGGTPDTGTGLWWFNGYIDDLRITKGVARYTSNFTPPAAPYPNLPAQSGWVDNIYADQWYGNNVLLLHGDGGNGGTSFIDSSPQRNTITYSGTAQTSTAVVKWGASSLYVNGSGGLSTTNTVLIFPGNFTVECWVYLVSSPAVNHDIVTIGNESSNRYVWYLNAGVLKSNLYGSPSNPSYGTLNLSTWYHLAFVRVGSTITVYINGVASGTDTQAGTIGNTGAANMLAGSSFTAYMDDLRITKGVARYTSNFNPPTAPFANLSPPGWDPFYQRVNLLLHMDGSNGSTLFIDNSPSAQSCTARGNASISTSVVKFGSGSLLLDGTGDDVVSSTNTNIGSGPFTLEAWIRPTSATTGRIISAQNAFTPNAVIAFRVDSTGSITFLLRNSSGGGLVLLTTDVGLISMDGTQWYHIAVTRNDNSLINIWVNGITRANINSSTSPNGAGSPYTIGSLDNNQEYFTGYIDDVRITEGIARYTANFQPPTGPFPNR